MTHDMNKDRYHYRACMFLCSYCWLS